MMHSFKLKMALFSAGTSGVILLGFALLFMSMIRRAGLERIDRHLQAVTEAQVRRPEPPEHWARFDAALAAMYGAERPRQFLVKVFGRDGQTVYASPRWPDALSDDLLNVPGYLRQKGRPEFRPAPPPPFRPGRFGEGPPPRLIPKPPRFMTVAVERRP